MATPSAQPQNYFSTSLSSPLTASDTTVYLNLLPTANEGWLEIDEGTSSKEIVYFTSKGSNFVTLPSVGAGRGQGGTTAVAHSTGATVKQKLNAEWWLALQNGTAMGLGSITPEKLTTGTGTSWTRQSWTPTWTTLTLGNGTVSATYQQIGKTVEFQIIVTFGSTTAMGSGLPTFTLPVTASSTLIGSGVVVTLGTAMGYDTSAGLYFALATWTNNSTTVGVIGRPSSDPVQHVALSSGLPFTWATGDVLSIRGSYPAA